MFVALGPGSVGPDNLHRNERYRTISKYHRLSDGLAQHLRDAGLHRGDVQQLTGLSNRQLNDWDTRGALLTVEMLTRAGAGFPSERSSR